MFVRFMLNLPVMNYPGIKRSVVFFILLLPILAAAQIRKSPIIDFPQSGSAVRGIVAVAGSSDVDGFQSAEVSYSFSQDENQNWFLIQQSSEAVSRGALATWDTTTITDGVYNLRLLVHLQNGNTLEDTVTGLRVRNYTPVETSTPEPLSVDGTLLPTPADTPTQAVFPTPTDLPANPVKVTSLQLSESMLQGALFVVGAAAVIGVYRFFRRAARRR
jgi:hypothetical protein